MRCSDISMTNLRISRWILELYGDFYDMTLCLNYFTKNLLKYLKFYTESLILSYQYNTEIMDTCTFNQRWIGYGFCRIIGCRYLPLQIFFFVARYRYLIRFSDWISSFQVYVKYSIFHRRTLIKKKYLDLVFINKWVPFTYVKV